MSTLEVEIDQEELNRVTIGRNRFLVFLGGALVAFATKLATATPAYAHPLPTFCYGAVGCHCCSGSQCCEGGCDPATCPDTGAQCWTVAVDAGGGCYDLFACCDWVGPWHGGCICRGGPQRVC